MLFCSFCCRFEFLCGVFDYMFDVVERIVSLLLLLATAIGVHSFIRFGMFCNGFSFCIVWFLYICSIYFSCFPFVLCSLVLGVVFSVYINTGFLFTYIGLYLFQL